MEREEEGDKKRMNWLLVTLVQKKTKRSASTNHLSLSMWGSQRRSRSPGHRVTPLDSRPFPSRPSYHCVPLPNLLYLDIMLMHPSASYVYV